MKWKKDEARAVFVLEPDEYSELLRGLEDFGIWWETYQLNEEDSRKYETAITVRMEAEPKDLFEDYSGEYVYFLCKKREEKEEE